MMDKIKEALGNMMIFFVLIIMACGVIKFQNHFLTKELDEKYQKVKPVKVLQVDTLKMANSVDLCIYKLSDKSNRYLSMQKYDFKEKIVPGDVILYLTDGSDEITDYRIVKKGPEK